MARRKSRSRSSSRLPTFFWMIITIVSGGGLGGYYNPDWPILGPIIKRISEGRANGNLSDQLKPEVVLETLNDIKNNVTGVHPNGTSGANTTPGTMTGAAGGTGTVTTPTYNYSQTNTQFVSAVRPYGKILIASFNIQVFGKAKMAKPEVVSVLAQIARQFDIVAIQEVRAQDDDILPNFVSAINAGTGTYSYLIGPRLGRTVSTEQYAFVYDTTRVEYNPASVGTVSDPSDLLHREPFVAQFRARVTPSQSGFTFWLVDIHTDPDEVPQEISALADVFQVMQRARADEDDVILLGDLNASDKELGRLGQVPGIVPVVRDVMTNTRKTKTYDNILFQSQATQEFTGRWGVLDFQSAFGLTLDQALEVSDHMPVWAEFTAFEAPPFSNVAGTSTTRR